MSFPPNLCLKALLTVLWSVCLLDIGSNVSQAQEKKRVIAHYMTDMVPRGDIPFNRWIDPAMAAPDGPTAKFGGLSQTVPMASVLLDRATLTEAVEFEIRAAKQMGVDGFQFYYPLLDETNLLTQHFNPIIAEFFKVAHAKYPEFKLTICLSHPSTDSKSTAERMKLWAGPIRELIAQTKDMNCWLESTEGRRLFYVWRGDSLVPDLHVARTADEVKQVGKAYQELSANIGEPLDFVQLISHFDSDPKYLKAISSTHYAVWGWTDSEENREFWNALNSECRKHSCQFTQTVYQDYFTSKVYAKGDQHYRILSNAEALKKTTAEIEKHYRVTQLAQTQIGLLKDALRRDVSIINYVTWNDYPEGHHLAPEFGRNFAPSLLLRHFKSQWIEGKPNVNRDQVMVFYKKYPHDCRPKFDIPIVIKSQSNNLSSEDRIEIVTLLTESAHLRVNGNDLGLVSPGLQISSAPMKPGKIAITLSREGEMVLKFETPTRITNSPSRTDRLTYSYSSEFNSEYQTLFGSPPPKRD